MATNLVPTIESTALPSTPANEWAQSTHDILGAHKPSTPLDMDPPVPGSFPEEPEQARSGETLVDTAKTYLPAEDNVQRAMTNAGQTAKAYLPQSVAAYLPSSESDLTPPRPPFATNDTDTASNLTNLSTEAQAGSLPPMPDDSASTLFGSATRNDTGSDNLSTTVHTGTSASPHPVAPLSPPKTPSPGPGESKFVEGLPTPPAHTSPAPLTTSPAPLTTSPVPLSSSSASEFGLAPVVSSSEQSEGIPAPPNSKATTADFEEAGVPAFPEREPEILPPRVEHAVDAPPSPESVGEPASPKKPKLVQRLKEKMHVGSHS